MEHHCHWPGCPKAVPPAMWGCYAHWRALPLHLRNAILKTYRPGQEVTKTPSRDYIAAATRVRDWITVNGRPAVTETCPARAQRQAGPL